MAVEADFLIFSEIGEPIEKIAVTDNNNCY
jgi:hypothetical protein